MFPSIDQAIAQFEGYGTPQAPTITNANNPGAIQSGPFATSQGAIGSSNGFAVFPDAATGLAAEDALVSRYASAGYSLQDLINAWSPPNAPGNTPQATANYINYVSQQTGMSPGQPLSQAAQQASGSGPTMGWSIGCSSVTPQTCASVDCSNLFTRFFSCCCKMTSGNVTQPNQSAGCAWYDILCKVNPLGGAGGTQSGLLGRAIAIILGLILITAGLFMLKPAAEISIGR